MWTATLDRVFDNETIHVYNAILDGEETTIESKSAIGEYKLYNDYSIDGDGYYEVSGSDVVVSDNDYTVDDLVYARGDDANVTVSGGSMVLNGEETFVISDDTQINVVLVPDEDAGSAMADIMTDRAADWEIYLGLTGKRLNSMLSNYGVSVSTMSRPRMMTAMLLPLSTSWSVTLLRSRTDPVI